MAEADTKVLEPYLPWHHRQWQQLQLLRQSQRLPHALLFSGPQGVGKKRFGQALAYALLCEKANQQGACGQCRQCQLMINGHPDLKVIEPEEGGRLIKVDQIRSVISFLSQTSHSGGYKIVLLMPAEAMNINAANAILKSLEEPSENSLLILISDAPGSLLATIRSRCQSLMFPVPDQREVLSWLTSSTANEAQSRQLLLEAQGHPLTALEYLNSGVMQKHQEMEKDFLAAMKGELSPLVVADRWKDLELQEILLWLSLRLNMLIKANQASFNIPEPWLPLQNTSAMTLFEVLDRVNQLLLKVKQGANPNRQLALETVLLLCCDTFRT